MDVASGPGPDENCTIHNDNMVPLRDGRYVAVSGNCQVGTWVTDAATGGAIKLDHLNPQTQEFSL